MDPGTPGKILGTSSHKFVATSHFHPGDLFGVPKIKRVVSPFFPGILLSREPLKTLENSWFLKRTMVEKNGESTPGKEAFLQFHRGLLFQVQGAAKSALEAAEGFVWTISLATVDGAYWCSVGNDRSGWESTGGDFSRKPHEFPYLLGTICVERSKFRLCLERV